MVDQVWVENDTLPDRKVLVGKRQFERVLSRDGWKLTDPPPAPEPVEVVEAAVVPREQKPNAAQRRAMRKEVEAGSVAELKKAEAAAKRKAKAADKEPAGKKPAAKSSSPKE
jgi:hypothetical protein